MIKLIEYKYQGGTSMKLKQWGKRLLALFLLLTILTDLLPTGLLLQAEANELPSEKPSETRIAGTVSSWDNDGDGTLSILAIGNSFSSDAMEYFYQIAKNLGISKMYLGNLYIAGCTLATHLSNANNDSASYTYYKNTSGSWSSTSNVKMSTALTERSWDFVTLQQASPNSGQANTYGSNLTNLIAYVKSKLKNPEATKLAWHMTWAYQADSTHSGFANYSNNQTTMYNKIIEAVNSQVVPNKDIEVIIPTGTAIQNLRSSILGDKLTRDGYHLSYGVGRYTAALMWVKELTGLDINTVTWKSTSTALSSNGEEKFLAIEAVNFAYKTPLAKTSSHYVNQSNGTPKLDPTWGFVQISPGNYKNQFWHSTGDYHTEKATTTTSPSNAKQYICTNKLSKDGTTAYNTYLPVGSIIVCYADYRYRPEGWVVDNKKQTGTRPDEVDDTYVIVTEEWWGNYTKRAFNISKDNDKDWSSDFSAGDVNHYFRIYIPIERVLEYYYQLDLTYVGDQYWNSSSSHKIRNTTTDNAGKFFAAMLPASVTTYDPATGENETTPFNDRRITKDMLPVGKGLISIRTGYKVRQEGWINGSTLNNTDANPRPGETHHNLHSTSSDWWDPYTLRGFNISYDGEGTNNVSNNSQATMESYILRVYVLRTEYPCAVQLEKELETAQKYLRWNNRLGQFPADLYAEFKKCVTESEALFRQRNKIRFVVPCTGTTKTKVENARNYQAQKLKNIIDKLAYYEVTDEFSNYIDLPIEVLDFRADGILFDNYNSNNPYSLSASSPGITNALTGESLPRAGSDFTTSDGTVVEHLTLPELVDGQLIYREETVTFIAHGIAQKLYAFGDTAHTPTDFKASYYGANWNSAFMNKITAGFGTTDMTTRLGSWSDTLKKVGLNQGLDGTVEGTNGGILKYTQVTTAFDLAYYMLNNIWRSVGESDPLVDESGTVLKRPDEKPLTYNTVVEELTSIRLIKGSNGFYSFTSESDVGRDPISGTLFNTINPKLSFSPKLNAVGELGFEKPGIYNPTTTGIVSGRSVTTLNATSNYDYMIHANGVFVYHKGKNLEFTFKGDDDVYFYINGSIACDVGGMHAATTRTCKLNDIADSLGLVDGDVCTFDMFLVDRHTSEVNLNFSTNIDLMASQAVTTELQTDRKTGAIISNNAIVADGTDVGFAFNLLNRSDYPVANLSFRNDKLDAYLSAESLTLGDFVDGNTLEDKVANLTITYTAYDPATKAYTNTTPQVMSAAEFDDLYSIIEGGCNSVSTIPLSEQAYTITGLTADQVMSLLELGLPCNVRISISGFHHIVYASVGTYTNEVTTVCYPVLKDGSLGAGLLGVASTSVQAKIMESKVHDPLRFVLDYSKPLEFSYSDIMSRVILAQGATASYIGMNRQGSHGQISDYKPSGMLLTSEGSTYASNNGIYDYHGNVFRFTLTRMLEEIEKINAVLEIHENGVSTTWYLMVAIEIVPATMVYYEAEDFTGTEISYAELSGGNEKTQFDADQNFILQEERNSLKASTLNTYATTPDPTHDTSILYFGFNRTDEEDVRYDKNPNYNGKNYDTNSAWVGTPGYNLNISNGNMNFTATTQNTNYWVYLSTGTTSTDTTGLSFKPGNDDWFEIRIKINDTSVLSNPSLIKFDLELRTAGTPYYKISHSKQVVESGSLSTEQFYTINFKMPANSGGWDNTIPYDQIGTAKRFVFLLTGLKNPSTANLNIDYIYIGPKEKMPSEQDRHLLFDFSNSAAEQYRYQSETYDCINYNLDNTWNYYAVRNEVPKVTNGCLKITNTASNDETYYWVRTGSDLPNNGVNYRPSAEDHCQVRFKIEDGEAVDPTSPYFRIYFSTDGVEIFDGNQDSCNFDLTNKADGEWITLSFPITNSRWYNADLIQDLQFTFGGIQNVDDRNLSIYIDYIYIGPSQAQDRVYTAEDLSNYNGDNALFFDFSGSKEEAARYDQAIYGFRNYTDLSAWQCNPNRNSTTLGTDSLIMQVVGSYVPGVDKKCNPYVQSIIPDEGSTSMPLSYVPTATDVAQVRVRFSNCVTKDESPIPMFCLYFMGNRSPYSSDGVWPNDFASIEFDKNVVTSGEWAIVTLPLNDVFRTADVINSIRFNFNNVISKNADYGIVEVDYLYIGPEEMAPATDVYGYDSSYDDDRGLSNGESLFMEGKGYKTDTAIAYSQASFTFKGTGFDLISRTNKKQATIRVKVSNAKGETERTLTINNMGELDLYQIPVVSMEDLPHGEHTVTIDINSPVEYTGVLAPLSRGGEFYLDAIRIYDPIEVETDSLNQDEETVLSAYVSDLEAYPYIKEVRDVLISATQFSTLEGVGTGAVYVDQAEEQPNYTESADPQSGTGVNNDLSVENHITYEISTYEKIGPKNEVYLNKGQAVAFKLRLNTVEVPVSIDVGAKGINKGDCPVLTVGYTTAKTTAPVTLRAWNVHTNTAMYYPIPFTETSFATDDDGRYLYLVISNSGNDSVLSITDLKFAYESKPTLLNESEPPVRRASETIEPVSYLVDAELAQVVNNIMNTELPQGDITVVDKDISIKHTLNLAGDISINYAVSVQSLKDYDTALLECHLYDGTIVLVEPEQRGEYYYFTLTGLTAAMMKDQVIATLRLTRGEEQIISEQDVYSIAQYAYNQLAKAETSPELKALCANLLRYGGATQVYKDYRTHELAHNALTEEHQALLTDPDQVLFGNNNSVGTELADPRISWVGKALDLTSRVGVKFIFSTASYEGDPMELSLRISYTDSEGQMQQATIEAPEVYNESNQLYAFGFYELPAAELRSILNVQVYAGDTPLSQIMTYSPDSYGNNKSGTLLELCKALFAYVDCAEGYFTSLK